MTPSSNAASPTELEAVTLSAWLWLCLLVGVAVSSALCVFSAGGLVDPVKHSLGLTDVQMGFVLGWAYVGPLAVCGLPAGWLADRAPRTLMLAAGTLMWAAGAAACALADSYLALCLGRGLTGLGVAALAPSAISILADAFPVRLRGRAFGVFLAALSVGPGLGMTVGGGLLSVTEPLKGPEAWRLAMGLTAAPALVMAAILFLSREPKRHLSPAGETSMATGGRDFWGPMLVTLLAVIAAALSDGAQLSWSAAALVREHTITPAEAARLTGYVFLSSGGAAPLIAGVLGDVLHGRYGAPGRVLVAIASTAALVLLQCFYSVQSTSLFLAILLAASIAVVTSEVIGAAVLQDIVPNGRRGLAASAHYLCTLGSIATGTSLVALAARSPEGSTQALTQALSAVTIPASSAALLGFVGLYFVVHQVRKNSRTAPTATDAQALINAPPSQ